MSNYQYYSGANVWVEIEDQAILEVAALSVQKTDSSTPVYGYSSVLFDAVAAGQRIVQGSLIINYIRPDYLYHAIAYSRSKKMIPPGEFDPYAPALGGAISSPEQINLNTVGGLEPIVFSDTNSVFDVGPVDIVARFAGQYLERILSAYFIGEGKRIQIDEQTIVEEYTFFARDIIKGTQPVITGETQ